MNVVLWVMTSLEPHLFARLLPLIGSRLELVAAVAVADTDTAQVNMAKSSTSRPSVSLRRGDACAQSRAQSRNLQIGRATILFALALCANCSLSSALEREINELPSLVRQ
jgi:hypothetical protein